MKTKIILLTSVAILGSLILHAQTASGATTGFSQGISSNGVQVDLQTFQNSQLTSKDATEPVGVDGTPFLFETYMPAEIYFLNSDQEPIRYNLNYNIYADLMKMSDSNEDTGEVKALPKGANYEVVMGNKNFRYMSFEADGEVFNNYVEILDVYENGDALVLRRSQEIQQAQSSGSTYSTPKNARLKSNDVFYYIDRDGYAFEMENHKRKVMDEMSGAAEKKVKNYIKENNIRFDDDLRGLKGVAKYYSSIK